MKKQPPSILVSDELLIAVFKYFPKKNPLKVSSEQSIHLAFHQMSKKRKYTELFENYPFDNAGVVPHSSMIGEAIGALKQSHLLQKVDLHTSELWYFTGGINIRFEKFIAPRLNDSQKKLIQNLSEEIRKYFKNKKS